MVLKPSRLVCAHRGAHRGAASATTGQAAAPSNMPPGQGTHGCSSGDGNCNDDCIHGIHPFAHLGDGRPLWALVEHAARPAAVGGKQLGLASKCAAWAGLGRRGTCRAIVPRHTQGGRSHASCTEIASLAWLRRLRSNAGVAIAAARQGARVAVLGRDLQAKVAGSALRGA
jgi:hypothetical protein